MENETFCTYFDKEFIEKREFSASSLWKVLLFVLIAALALICPTSQQYHCYQGYFGMDITDRNRTVLEFHQKTVFTLKKVVYCFNGEG